MHMQDSNTTLKTLVGEKWSLYPNLWRKLKTNQEIAGCHNYLAYTITLCFKNRTP